LNLTREPIPTKLRTFGLTLPDTTAQTNMTVPATRFAIAAERLSYERMDVQFPPSPALTFSGSIGLTDGTVKLLLTGPTEAPGVLSSGTIRLPITGTVSQPLIAVPGGR
jgi:hypothetical protein